MADEPNMEFSPSMLKHVKARFGEQQKTTETSGGFDGFLKSLAAPESSASLPITVDTKYPISQYFISSSHNTYLTGNQLWSKSSVDPYKDVLKRGCRCIEIDVWDGGSHSATSSSSPSDVEDDGKREDEDKDKEMKRLAGMVKKGLGRLRSISGAKPPPKADEAVDSPAGDEVHMPTPWRTISSREEPRVLHGYTATKEIPFRSVCEVIRDYAFRSSDLPLIVSLEVHCNHEQQALMVEIMNDYWKKYLVQIPPDFSDRTPLPSLESLRKKILIKVKFSPPKKEGSGKSKKEILKGDEDHDVSDDEGQDEATKKGKIIEALSNLGIYVRSCHFDNLAQPEAQMPTHVFALSEKRLISLQEEHQEGLFKHNLSYFMRVYPKGTRVRSSNLDPAPFWRQGIQMVALNWQQMSASMMLNDAMFTGTGGWVVKPDGYREAAEGPSAIKRVKLDLSVQVFAAQNLDRDSKSTPNVYIKCELHVETKAAKEGETIPKGGKNKGGEWKQRTAVRHSKDPDFSGETMEFKDVEGVVPELSFIRIKVMDDDAFQKDRMLGWACFRVDRFPTGLRLLQLKGPDSKPDGSSLLVETRLDIRE